MRVEYLNPEFIFYIHMVAIDEEFCEYDGHVNYSKEMRGIKDINLFKSAIYEPKQSFGDQDLYPGIIDKAACYLRSLSMNHPFYDGNKRTAVLVTIIFLEMNGYKVLCNNDELYDLIKKIVEEKSSIQEIVKLITPYVRISKMNKLKQIFHMFNLIWNKQ